MAPFVAIVRLLIASFYAGTTIAIGHAVAAITFALLITVLYVGAIARPILREHCCDAQHTTCDQNNRTPCSNDISHSFLFLVNGFEPQIVPDFRRLRKQNSYLRFDPSSWIQLAHHGVFAENSGRFQDVFDPADGDDDPVGAVV